MDETKPSKSARKRDYLARQKLGEELIPLQEADLHAMGLDEDLLDAVLEADTIEDVGTEVFPGWPGSVLWEISEGHAIVGELKDCKKRPVSVRGNLESRRFLSS